LVTDRGLMWNCVPGCARVSHQVSIALPDEPQPLQRQFRVDGGDRAGVRRDQVGEAAGRDHGCVGRAELLADALDDRVDLAGEALDEA
jgi:hypothetical protein